MAAPVALPFTARLARENGWSRAYAERVVEEYRRFVFLAMVAGHPVTPSEEVDQAWHLHLLYVESYWHRFVGEVLPRPLVHGPTKGGQAEGAKFQDWYARTLASYEAWFGARPPVDIWPPSAERFSQRHVRVNLAEAYVLPKAKVRRLAQVGFVLATTLIVGGCLATANATGSPIGVWIIGGLAAAILLVIAVVHLIGNAESRGKRGQHGCGGGCGGGCATSSSGGSRESSGSDDASGCGSSGCGGGGCGGGGD